MVMKARWLRERIERMYDECVVGRNVHGWGSKSPEMKLIQTWEGKS
jgi:hypothetical protein